MNGLPTDADLSFLEGATLLQVCVGENEVILNLDPDISIMVASVIRMTTGDGVALELADAPESGRSMLALLGHGVAAVAHDPDGTLRRTWDGGEVTELLDSWKEFESYTIRHGDTLLVV